MTVRLRAVRSLRTQRWGIWVMSCYWRNISPCTFCLAATPTHFTLIPKRKYSISFYFTLFMPSNCVLFWGCNYYFDSRPILNHIMVLVCNDEKLASTPLPFTWYCHSEDRVFNLALYVYCSYRRVLSAISHSREQCFSNGIVICP